MATAATSRLGQVRRSQMRRRPCFMSLATRIDGFRHMKIHHLPIFAQRGFRHTRHTRHIKTDRGVPPLGLPVTCTPPVLALPAANRGAFPARTIPAAAPGPEGPGA